MDMNEFESSGMMGDIPEAFRKYMGLESLESIVYASNARGAIRLFTCPDFEPIEAITIIYLDDKVIATLAVSDDEVWERISCGDEQPIDPPVSQPDRELSASDLPSQFQNWELIADALMHAESCMSDNLDGNPYYHFAFGEGIDSIAAWFNPTEADNPRQCAIIEAYSQIKILL